MSAKTRYKIYRLTPIMGNDDYLSLQYAFASFSTEEEAEAYLTKSGWWDGDVEHVILKTVKSTR